MDPNCKTIPSENFPNARLCDWLSQKLGVSPKSWDTGETYVDLNDPFHPRVQKNEPDGKISPRELHTAATQVLEEEWRRIFSGDRFLSKRHAQPLAEGLYDRFHFLPPWLPKPLASLRGREKDIFLRFVAEPKPINHNPEKAIEENKLLGILKAGVASCVGEVNVFYFAKKIIEGTPVEFIEVYRDTEGNQYSHVAVQVDEKPYDPSYRQDVEQDYHWFPLHPMDQWALSLMNTGISRLERKQIDGPRYMFDYGLYAHDLAPDYYRVQFNLGEAFYSGGEIETGIRFLRGARKLYPAYQRLQEWQGKI